MKISQHTKLSILVVVIAAVLLEVNTALEYFATRRSFNAQLTEKAQRDLNQSYRIAKLKQEVEAAVNNTLPELERLIDESDIDTLRLVMRHLASTQEQIVGVAVGFVPGYLVNDDVDNVPPELLPDACDGRFCIYYNEIPGADGKEELIEGVFDEDYTQRSWYKLAMQSGGHWSEPYQSKAGRYFYLACSYSLPVHASDGELAAVLQADVPLRELSAMAAQFYENQQRSLLNNLLLHLVGLAILAFIIFWSVQHIRRLHVVNAEKERIANELAIASNIQQSMIPKTFPGYPERDDVELYASLTPAREVGGDFYDFLIRDNRLFFCIGDVSGKGVPAALLMAVSRSLFRTEAGREDSPAAIVGHMSHTFCDEQSAGYFATMFVGVLDLATGRLDYCNAGHEAPLLNGEALTVVPNLPVGALADWEYEGQSATLQQGDTLFIYTDGLSEARDMQGTLFSRQRTAELARTHAGGTPRQLIETMNEAVAQYAGKAERSDDITMMAVQWRSGSITLRADTAELPRMKDFVLDAAGRAGLSDKEATRLRLAVEESVTNVIQYAYARKSGASADPVGAGASGKPGASIGPTVTLEAATRDGMLALSVIDSGRAFDPTQAPVADTSVPADKRDVGGLGILFIRKMSDALEYRRENGLNILTIKKFIPVYC